MKYQKPSDLKRLDCPKCKSFVIAPYNHNGLRGVECKECGFIRINKQGGKI